MDEFEQIRIKVTEKIGEVEQAVDSLQSLRKSLLQKAYETKQSILASFINHRDSMQCREMKLLSEVDTLLHSKDNALVTQLSKLNQVLGCLRNCLQSDHPCGDCLEKFEDIDLIPVLDVGIEFSSASEQLKNTIHSYGCLFSGQSKSDDVMKPTNESGGDLVIKWLVTPTNAQPRDKHEHKSRIPEQVTTEWLIDQHPTSPGTGTSSLFSAVRSDDISDWLNSDEVAPPYDDITAATAATSGGVSLKDWLVTHKEAVDTRSLYSDGSWLSDFSSTATSSCVVLPGGSDCGSALVSCCPVSEWMETCSPCEHQDGSWLARPRRVSVLSFSSDMDEVPDSQRPTPSSMEYEWLVSADQKLDDWVPHPKRLNADVSEDWLDEEKHDVSMEKDDWLHNSSSEWLPQSLKQLCLMDDDWLLNAASNVKYPTKSYKPTDKEWLLVVNTFSKIAASNERSWLLHSEYTETVDKETSGLPDTPSSADWLI